MRGFSSSFKNDCKEIQSKGGIVLPRRQSRSGLSATKSEACRNDILSIIVNLPYRFATFESYKEMAVENAIPIKSNYPEN